MPKDKKPDTTGVVWSKEAAERTMALVEELRGDPKTKEKVLKFLQFLANVMPSEKQEHKEEVTSKQARRKKLLKKKEK